MSKKVVLFADSTCDLGTELCERYNVHLVPYHINLDDTEYLDNVTITSDVIFNAWRTKKILPKTSAISTGEYIECFRPWIEQGYEIVHINLGGALSVSHTNCRMAAEELPGLYPIDSCNLSTGTGLLVIEAAKMIEAGASAAEVQAAIQNMTGCVHASFILDTLEFMHAGGRCSSIAMLGANLLSLKPCIEVNNTNGSMGVGKKYRGKFASVLKQYVKDKLAAYPDILTDRIFITYSSADQEILDMVREVVSETMPFTEIFTTTASCTISCHCGPNTLGILFLTETPSK